ncbi:hypothetical protein [Streptomyces sp. NPDC088725]|uniref:hypothetical protein n=1 Tax=Streptomyces sp. NPDC088725 TaxID=3365873 RepID=UPI003819D308
MTDRRRRTALHLPQPAGPVLLPRERQSSSTGPSGAAGSDGSTGSQGSTGSDGSTGSQGSTESSDHNPFAPPPEGSPDQPWRPRRPENGGSPDDESGSGRGGGSGWGSQWSSRQPGRSSDGFGSRPGSQTGPSGQNDPNAPKGGPEGVRGGPRWDPTDPVQRRARYALLSGMWAFFFALFDFPEIALLLGALAVYWGASSLRNKPLKARQSPDAKQSASVDAITGRAGTAVDEPSAAAAQPAGRPPVPGGAPYGTPGRPQTTAAVSGLVTASLALVIVAATFTVQLVYRDYYSCVNDALTKTGQLSCNSELPHDLWPLFGVKE